MNIVHISPYYAPAWTFGGVVSAVSGMAEALAARGHQVTVLTTDVLDHWQRNPITREIVNGVTVIRVRNLSHTLRARLNLSTPLGWRQQWASLQPQIIHTHELRTVENILLPRSTPILLSPHGTLSHTTGRGAFKRSWDTLLGTAIARKIRQVVALTEMEAEEARYLWDTWRLPRPPIPIIPNGVAADFSTQVAQTEAAAMNLRHRYQIRADQPVILFLGRLHERKGLQYLIPAVAQLNAEAHLLVVGPDEGMLATAQQLSAAHHLTSRVTFTGLLTGIERLAALRAADVFVLPAVGEGLSMASIEAMAAGLPVILTPGCNLPMVEQRGAGLLVERQIEPLRAALGHLLADPAVRQRMGQHGQAWVKQQFTWPVIAQQLEDVYQMALRD